MRRATGVCGEHWWISEKLVLQDHTHREHAEVFVCEHVSM